MRFWTYLPLVTLRTAHKSEHVFVRRQIPAPPLGGCELYSQPRRCETYTGKDIVQGFVTSSFGTDETDWFRSPISTPSTLAEVNNQVRELQNNKRSRHPSPSLPPFNLMPSIPMYSNNNLPSKPGPESGSSFGPINPTFATHNPSQGSYPPNASTEWGAISPMMSGVIGPPFPEALGGSSVFRIPSTTYPPHLVGRTLLCCIPVLLTASRTSPLARHYPLPSTNFQTRASIDPHCPIHFAKVKWPARG